MLKSLQSELFYNLKDKNIYHNFLFHFEEKKYWKSWYEIYLIYRIYKFNSRD